MQFYLKDWLADTRVLTLAERGLWIDALAYMWRSPERGTLKMQNGCKPDAEALRMMFGTGPGEAERVLARLVAVGVASTTADGVVYCRRMRREAEAEATKSELGRKAAQARWGAEPMRNNGSPTPTPYSGLRSPSPKDENKASSDADAGRVSPDPTPDPKAAERAERRRLAEVNLAWFHRRYAEIVGHDSPDKPTDGRIHPAEVRAAEKLSRLVKAGRYAPRQLDGVLRAWLKGEFFSSPNGKLSTFVAVLASGKLDLAANRKSPRVDETPGAGRSGTGSGGFKTVGKILTGGE